MPRCAAHSTCTYREDRSSGGRSGSFTSSGIPGGESGGLFIVASSASARPSDPARGLPRGETRRPRQPSPSPSDLGRSMSPSHTPGRARPRAASAAIAGHHQRPNPPSRPRRARAPSREPGTSALPEMSTTRLMDAVPLPRRRRATRPEPSSPINTAPARSPLSTNWARPAMARDRTAVPTENHRDSLGRLDNR